MSCENGQIVVKIEMKMENSYSKKFTRSFMLIVLMLLLQYPLAGKSPTIQSSTSISLSLVAPGRFGQKLRLRFYRHKKFYHFYYSSVACLLF